MIIENGKTIQLKRDFALPAKKVYDAWSNPTLFTAWWKDLKVAKMDFRVGGKYRLEWGGDDFVIGEYLEIIPGSKIVMTWETDAKCSGGVPEIQKTRITLLFEDKGPNESAFELKHEGLLGDIQIDSHHWGWTHALYEFDNAYLKPEAKADHVLEITRTLSAPVEKVFSAWTNPDFLNRWFNRDGAKQGRPTCDFRKGGNLILDYELESGEVIRHYAQFSEIVTNKKLAFDWITDYCPYETYLTVEFKPVGDKTELKLVHRGFRDEEIKEGHGEGWTSCLNAMDKEAQEGFVPAIQLTREFPVSLDKLYAACASRQFFDQTNADVTTGKFDFRVGGKYEFSSEACVKGGFVRGDFLRIIPNAVIAMTWDAISPEGPTGVTFLTLRFQKIDENRSALHLTHHGFKTEAQATVHRGGWTSILETWEIA